MKRIPTLIFSFLTTLFFLLLSSKVASATVLFQDDFNDGNANGWIVEGVSGWNVVSGKYGIAINPMFSTSNSLPSDEIWNNNWKDYIYEVDLKGVQGVDKNVIFRYKDPKNFYEVHHGLGGATYLDRCKGDEGYHVANPVIFRLANGPTQHFKIEVNGNHFKVHVNGYLLFDVDDTIDPLLEGKIGLRGATGVAYPTEVWFDNVLVTGLGPTPSPTPTPTPTPTLHPLILLPGLGASWNYEAMILGKTDEKHKAWSMTPGVKVYDGLIQTLKNSGYQTEGANKNLFIFNYDWTKPVNSIADDLKNYVKNVVHPPSGVKIDLVGHSLGGLVARTYVQNNPNNSVNQLLTLGSPHEGIAQTYYLWEGGDLKKSLAAWQRIAVGLLLHIREPEFPTTAQTIHSVIPAIKDLLPTFSSLKQGGKEKPVESLREKNDWLINLNASIPNHLLSVLNTFSGILSNSTLRWIQVNKRGWLEEALNLWPDGQPTGQEEFSAGDQTVLTTSSQLGTRITNLENLNHKELVETAAGQQKIMETLGLLPTSISTISANISYESTLVFQLSSPATLSVFNENNNPVGYGNSKMIVIPGATAQEYQIKIIGTGSGEYQLRIGQITSGKDIWNVTSGTVKTGEEIIYSINFNPSSPSENPIIDKTGKIYKKSARAKLVNLKNYINSDSLAIHSDSSPINQAILYLDQNLLEKAIIYLYQLRYPQELWQGVKQPNQTRDRIIKAKIMDIISDLEVAYVSSESGVYPPLRLRSEINLAERYFNEMAEKLKRATKEKRAREQDGLLYSLALQKLNRAKSSSSYKAHINALGAQYLSLEGIKFIR